MRPIYILAMICGVFGAVGSAWAQSLDLTGGDGQEPITIDAQGGIEWSQKDQVFIATGPARATRGIMVLDADEMRAYYRPKKIGGGSEVYRLDALGHVVITSPGRVAKGNHAVYDVDTSVIVLKDGNPVTLTAGDDIITTDGQLEFWQLRDMAVARAKSARGSDAIRADKRIQANVLTAHFTPNDTGKTELGRVEAFENVIITTKTEQVFAERGAYNVPTGLARLTGSVKIKKGDNVINGCSADIDLNSGISRMNSCDGVGVNGTSGSAPGDSAPGAPRVHGVLAPTNKK